MEATFSRSPLCGRTNLDDKFFSAGYGQVPSHNRQAALYPTSRTCKRGVQDGPASRQSAMRLYLLASAAIVTRAKLIGSERLPSSLRCRSYRRSERLAAVSHHVWDYVPHPLRRLHGRNSAATGRNVLRGMSEHNGRD